MKGDGGVTDQEVQDIIERGRQIGRAPDVVRARLLARARAIVAVGAPRPPSVLSATRPTPPAWRGRRVAFAAIGLVAFATAGAAAALHVRARHAPDVEQAPLPGPEQPAVRGSAPRLPAAHPAVAVAPTGKTRRTRRWLTPQESYAAELRLLQRAQSDYASRDFAGALVLVAEHGRQFPDGRLAEEREALRVRSLAAVGRGDEARRALAAFVRRFPASAFLPGLQETARAAD